jgi:hypothetical protein
MTAHARHPAGRYPVHVDATLDHPTKWLWLRKWLLAVPRYLVVGFFVGGSTWTGGTWLADRTDEPGWIPAQTGLIGLLVRRETPSETDRQPTATTGRPVAGPAPGAASCSAGRVLARRAGNGSVDLR